MSKNINLISIVLVALFSFFILLKGLDKSNTYSPSIDKSKIDFNFKSKYLFSEKEVFLNELLKNEGMTLVNIWASWCIPCRDEHPYLMELKKNKKLEIVGLNYKDKVKSANNFLNELNNPYTLILSDTDGTIAIEWGAYGVPETFLIYNGKIIKKIIGPMNNNLFREIERVVK